MVKTRALTAEGLCWIPGLEIKILQALRHGGKKPKRPEKDFLRHFRLFNTY